MWFTLFIILMFFWLCIAPPILGLYALYCLIKIKDKDLLQCSMVVIVIIFVGYSIFINLPAYIVASVLFKFFFKEYF